MVCTAADESQRKIGTKLVDVIDPACDPDGGRANKRFLRRELWVVP